MNRRDVERKLDFNQDFDPKMVAYLSRHGVMVNRRGFLGLTAGASLGVWTRSGIRALAQEGTSTFAFGLDANVSSLEPALSYDVTSNSVVCQISEGLLRFDATGQLHPLLAERWEHPDPLTYVYTLRQGVTFHDGATLTANNVLASIDRVRDPEIGSPMAWMYDAVETVTATDERTVMITLASPSALFQYVPAVTAGHVVSRAAIEE